MYSEQSNKYSTEYFEEVEEREYETKSKERSEKIAALFTAWQDNPSAYTENDLLVILLKELTKAAQRQYLKVGAAQHGGEDRWRALGQDCAQKVAIKIVEKLRQDAACKEPKEPNFASAGKLLAYISLFCGNSYQNATGKQQVGFFLAEALRERDSKERNVAPISQQSDDGEEVEEKAVVVQSDMTEIATARRPSQRHILALLPSADIQFLNSMQQRGQSRQEWAEKLNMSQAAINKRFSRIQRRLIEAKEMADEICKRFKGDHYPLDYLQLATGELMTLPEDALPQTLAEVLEMLAPAKRYESHPSLRLEASPAPRSVQRSHNDAAVYLTKLYRAHAEAAA